MIPTSLGGWIAAGVVILAVIAVIVLVEWQARGRESEAERNAREQEKIRLLALKALGEGKQGRREAA